MDSLDQLRHDLSVRERQGGITPGPEFLSRKPAVELSVRWYLVITFLLWCHFISFWGSVLYLATDIDFFAPDSSDKFTSEYFRGSFPSNNVNVNDLIVSREQSGVDIGKIRDTSDNGAALTHQIMVPRAGLTIMEGLGGRSSSNSIQGGGSHGPWSSHDARRKSRRIKVSRVVSGNGHSSSDENLKGEAAWDSEGAGAWDDHDGGSDAGHGREEHFNLSKSGTNLNHLNHDHESDAKSPWSSLTAKKPIMPGLYDRLGIEGSLNPFSPQYTERL